ncbi:molybdenum cofactor biosynthesis protein MoaB [Candidatus Bathyarchaeota archaeon]|jgi:molybdenum cofactor biosynthesis protein B|nr:molybdenum cofactor biosynthesis protein MoaB [Candidatus Bathyarchaeota archaeon]
MSETARGHKEEAPKKLQFGIYVCSTSRYEQMKKGQKVEDASGGLIESLLENAGHTVSFRKIISDDPDLITQSVQYIIDCADIDAAVFCGGTGITHSDVTIETVTPFLEKVLPGFGEIFRRLSYDEIGSAAVMSRAIAGVSEGKAFFCIPGSPNAVRLCLEKLVLPEVGHILRHARE